MGSEAGGEQHLPGDRDARIACRVFRASPGGMREADGPVHAALAAIPLSSRLPWADGARQVGSDLAADGAAKSAAEWMQPALGWTPNGRARLGERAARAEKEGHTPASFDGG